MSEKNKRQLVVYNTNRPMRFFCFDIRMDKTQGVRITQAEFNAIEVACDGGPYLAFFRDKPGLFYRLRRFYNNEDDVHYEPWITCLKNDERQQRITRNLIHKIEEMENEIKNR